MSPMLNMLYESMMRRQGRLEIRDGQKMIRFGYSAGGKWMVYDNLDLDFQLLLKYGVWNEAYD